MWAGSQGVATWVLFGSVRGPISKFGVAVCSLGRLGVRVRVGSEGIPWGLRVHCDASYELSRVGLM